MCARSLASAALLVAMAASHGQAQEAGELPAAVEATRRAFVSTSVRAVMVQQTILTEAYYRATGEARSRPARNETVYDWAAKGPKVYWSFSAQSVDPSRTGAAATAESRMWQAYDGTRYTGVQTMPGGRGQQGSIARSGPLLGNPREYGYTYHGYWWADLLTEPGFRVTGSTVDPTYGELITVQGTAPRTGIPVTARFAPRYGHLAVIVEARLPDYAASCKGYSTIYRADRVERIQGLWLPVKGSYEWRVCERGRPVAIQRKHWRLESVAVGGVADATFRMPELQPGSLVRNSIEQRNYLVGADGELMPYGSFGSAAGAASSRDTAAGWLFMVSTVTVLVVGAMGFLRWRRAVARR